MPNTVRAARISRLRETLARRLAWSALAGLGAVAALALALLAGAVIALLHARDAFGAGLAPDALPWVAIALGLGLPAVFLLRLLAAPAPAPAGVRLPREAAPDFFLLLDEIARCIGAQPVSRVWIGSEINAAVIQRPRWGAWGPLEAELVLGLPLVHSVSRPQLAAVLAHEFAHLALQRSGYGGIGAHLRSLWMRVLDGICEGVPVVERVARAPLRRLCHDLLRLSRLEEYEADYCAGGLVGRRLLGQTLLEVGLKAHFLQHDYWPMVEAHSDQRPKPAIRPFREMGLGMAAGFLREKAAVERLRERALGEGPRGLHPGLHHRLRALRVPFRAAPESEPSAADHYFGPLLPTLAWVFDREWWTSICTCRKRCARPPSALER